MRFRIIISIVIEGAYVDSGIEKKLRNFASIIGAFLNVWFLERKPVLLERVGLSNLGMMSQFDKKIVCFLKKHNSARDLKYQFGSQIYQRSYY